MGSKLVGTAAPLVTNQTGSQPPSQDPVAQFPSLNGGGTEITAVKTKPGGSERLTENDIFRSNDFPSMT